MVAAASLAAGGCVRRTVTVNTDPQGATVILNDRLIGTSPASVDFTWYGDYSVIIKKDGFETLSTHQRLNPPWYQVPPIDFFSEGLTPFWIHDQQTMSFTLEPRKPIDRDELVRQARDFRDRALYESDATTRPAGTQPASK